MGIKTGLRHLCQRKEIILNTLKAITYDYVIFTITYRLLTLPILLFISFEVYGKLKFTIFLKMLLHCIE